MSVFHADIGRSVILGCLRYIFPLIGYAFFYPIILQKSGAEVLGLWSLFATISIYVNLTDIGFSLHLIREATSFKSVQELSPVYEDYLTARRTYLLALPVLAIAAPLSVEFLLNNADISYSRTGLLFSATIFAVSAIVSLISKLEQAILQSGMDNGVVQIVTGVRQVLPLPFGIAGAYAGWPIESFAIGVFVGDILMLGFYRWRIYQRHSHWIDASHFVSWKNINGKLAALFHQAGFLYLLSVAQFVRGPVLRLIIATVFGLTAAAAFEIAWRISMLVFTLLSTGFSALYPSFSALNQTSKKGEMLAIFKTAFICLSGPGIWVCAQFYIFAEYFLTVWLGDINPQLVISTKILLIWSAIQLFFVPFWHLNNALGYEKYVFLSVAMHSTITVLFLFLNLPLDQTLLYWVTGGLAAYCILGFAGPEISYYLKMSTHSKTIISLLPLHLMFAGLIVLQDMYTTDWSFMVFAGIEFIYFCTIILLSFNALSSFLMPALGKVSVSE